MVCHDVRSLHAVTCQTKRSMYPTVNLSFRIWSGRRKVLKGSAEDTQIDTNTYDSTKNTHTINETYETIN